MVCPMVILWSQWNTNKALVGERMLIMFEVERIVEIVEAHKDEIAGAEWAKDLLAAKDNIKTIMKPSNRQGDPSVTEE